MLAAKWMDQDTIKQDSVLAPHWISIVRLIFGGWTKLRDKDNFWMSGQNIENNIRLCHVYILWVRHRNKTSRCGHVYFGRWGYGTKTSHKLAYSFPQVSWVSRVSSSSSGVSWLLASYNFLLSFCFLLTHLDRRQIKP